MGRKRASRKVRPVAKSSISVLLVDDSNVFLDLEERWLSRDPRLEIIGRASSGQEALDQVRRLTPDVVVMDVTMQNLNGLEAAEYIKAQTNPPRIVLLTVEISEAFKKAARDLKVDAYLTKAQLSTKLLPVLLDLFPHVTLSPQRPHSPDRDQ
jgi:DNA-binding NarL/FixJ family response regulator